MLRDGPKKIFVQRRKKKSYTTMGDTEDAWARYDSFIFIFYSSLLLSIGPLHTQHTVKFLYKWAIYNSRL